MSNKKQHNTEAGYITERKNPYAKGKVVIYIAKEQGVDAEKKYIIVCDAHGTMGADSSVPKARIALKNPDNFCEECARIKAENNGGKL